MWVPTLFLFQWKIVPKLRSYGFSRYTKCYYGGGLQSFRAHIFGGDRIFGLLTWEGLKVLSPRFKIIPELPPLPPIVNDRSLNFKRKVTIREERKQEKWSSAPFSISRVNPSHDFLWRKVRKRRKIEKSEGWLGRSQVAEGQKNNSQIPLQDLKLTIRKVLCRHLKKVSLTMVVRLLLDYLYALLYLVFSIIYI